MRHPGPRISPRKQIRIRFFQMSGIALITLSLLNLLFLEHISLQIDLILMSIGLTELFFSFWLWSHARQLRTYRPQ